jgi:hypothetical protein
MRATSKLGAITAEVELGGAAGFADSDGVAGAAARGGAGCAALAWSMTAWSLNLRCHATPSAIAITTAPTATNAKTVRDMKLPTVRRRAYWPRIHLARNDTMSLWSGKASDPCK